MGRTSKVAALALSTMLVGTSAVLAETINILVEGGGEQLQKAVAEKFTKETGIEVKFTVVPYAGVYDKLSAEFAAGSSNYDVATIDVIWMAKFAEFAESLDPLFTEAVKADLAPALLADAQFGGRFIGMPAWANAEILFYRSDLFTDPAQQAAFKQKYGYDLAPPENWQQFRDAAIFFTQDTNGDGKTDLYGTDVIGANPEEWMAQVLQAGSPGVVLDDKGNVIIDNDAHLKALQFYTDLYCKDRVAPEGAAQVDWGAAQNLFYQGQTALMKFWAHAYRLTPEDSKVSGKVGVMPMIAGEAGIAAIPGPWYNIVPKTSAHKDAAMKFVAFAIANNAMGIEAPLGLAATNSAYQSYMGKPGFEHFAPLLETLGAPGTKGRPLVAEWQEIVDQAVTPMLQEALACNADLPALLKNAKVTIEDML
jgi:ABC-type glycerol-3-phosphate transport system substrate-binding protein